MPVYRKLGWKPSPPDIRNKKYSLTYPIHSLATLPSSVDLRKTCPPVYDQGELGSCTAQSVAGLAQFLLIKDKKPSYVPSRLFIYYNERVMENSVKFDNGATLISGMKVLRKFGAPHEKLWWYNEKKFTVKPNKKVYDDGLNHQIKEYLAVDNGNIEEIKTILSEGYPLVFGCTVYNSFLSSSTEHSGIVTMPKQREKMAGGHAMLIVGYNDTKKLFIVRNSWGVNWGDKGYCYFPYDYITNRDLSDDFWTAREIE